MKPNIVEEVLILVKDQLENKIIVSLASGFPFEKYQEIILGTHHLSIIPNIPISVGEGTLICENKHSLTQEKYQLVHSLFSGIALIESVDSDQLSIAGTLSGCGPSFVSMFIEALGDAGVKHSLSRNLAYALAEKMVLGTSSLLLRRDQHPAAMKDTVCSPKCSTITGVAVLERKSLRSAVIEAIDSIEN